MLEVFERGRTRGDDRQSLFQVVVYLEGLPASSLEFGEEGISRRTSRPVLEVAWTYAPASGELEVLARGGRQQRVVLGTMFIWHLLGRSGDATPISLRRFTLEPLRTTTEFPTDAEDGIARVLVRRLRLRPLDGSSGAMELERDKAGNIALHELARQWFRSHDPLRTGFRFTGRAYDGVPANGRSQTRQARPGRS